MSETLSIRLPAEEKRALFELAARSGKSVNELVRGTIRARLAQDGASPTSALAQFFGSVDIEARAPTNETVRAAMLRA